MLHVLLLILKIIGILILVILGLILLLIGIVLFVPLRYQANGGGNGDLKSLWGKVNFSFLLHLVAGYASYQDQKLDWNVRIAWKWLNKSESEVTAKEMQAMEDTDKSSLSEKMEFTEEIEEEKSTPPTPAHTETEAKLDLEPEIKLETKPKPEQKPETEPKSETQPKSETKEPAPQKPSIFVKIKAFFEKLKYTFQKICDNIKALTEKKDKLADFVNDEIHRNALSRVLRELKRFLGFLKPKKFHLKAHFGFQDPSITGKVLAVLSMLYPFVGKNHLCAEPDFEQEVYEGELLVRGHIRVIYVIIIGWNLIWDKNIRTTYKHIRNFKL